MIKLHRRTAGQFTRQILVTLFLALLTLPVIALIWAGFQATGDSSELSWSGYHWLIMSTDIANRSLFDAQKVFALMQTLRLAAIVTFSTLILALPVAYLFSLISKTLQSWILIGLCLTVWLSPFVKSFGFAYILSLLPDEFTRFSYPLIIVMTANALPVMALSLIACLSRLDRHLINVASDLYTPRWRIAYLLIIPKLIPGILLGSLLVFIPALMAFFEPTMVNDSPLSTLGPDIQILARSQTHFPIAAAYASLVVILTLIICNNHIMKKVRTLLP